MDYVVKDDFFNSVKDEVTCSICLDIKIDPMMCNKCQNSYCANCINNWQKQSSSCPFKCQYPSYTSSRIVKNLICKLNFKCKNGCNEIIPFEKLKTHYEFECTKLDYKEKYEKLLVKYNQLLLEKNQLEEKLKSSSNNEIDSRILDNRDEILFIQNILSQSHAPGFKLNLIYRATRDGDMAQNFHEHCDNKQGGILIITGKNVCGNINFLFQINKRKKYELTNYMKILTSIYCRANVGPCFGELGEDIWVKGQHFLTNGGLLHKDKDKGRICSFNTDDYELTNGERNFNIKELEAFWLNY